MRHHFSSSSETIKAWLSGHTSHGQNSRGSLLFRGDTLYSYGDHFVMARKHEIKGRRYIFRNTASYSVTTSRHQSHLAHVIDYNKSICLPCMNNGIATYDDYWETWQAEINTLIEDFNRLLSRTQVRRLEQASHWLRQANQMAALLGWQKRLHWPEKIEQQLSELAKWHVDKVNAAKVRQQEQRRIRQEAYDNRQRLMQEARQSWVAGNQLSKEQQKLLRPVCYRIRQAKSGKSNLLESSDGYYYTLKWVREVWSLYRQCVEFQTNITNVVLKGMGPRCCAPDIAGLTFSSGGEVTIIENGGSQLYHKIYVNDLSEIAEKLKW